MVAGLAKLVSMLSPASALFEALREAYETVVFYIEKADRFAALLDTIVGAITDIANRPQQGPGTPWPSPSPWPSTCSSACSA